MQKHKNRSNRTVEVLIGFGIFLTLFLAFGDMVSNAKYSVRSKICRKNLQIIGTAIGAFRVAHHGMMPPNLAAITKNLPNKCVLVCPETGANYDYRPLQNPLPGDVICWDDHWERPDHSILFWLNVPSRNVLTADDKIKMLPEQTFQALHLQH